MSGRVDALNRFRARLSELANQLEEAERRPDFDDTNTAVERACCVEMLAATEELVRGIGCGGHKVAELFVRLMTALENVQSGRTDPFVIPARTGTRPSLPPIVLAFRGRVAAVQQMLMDDGAKEDEAAQRVFRHLGEPAAKLIRYHGLKNGVDWKSVRRWRREANLAASTEPDKDGFQKMRATIAAHINPAETPDARSARLLRGIAKAAARLIRLSFSGNPPA